MSIREPIGLDREPPHGGLDLDDAGLSSAGPCEVAYRRTRDLEKRILHLIFQPRSQEC